MSARAQATPDALLPIERARTAWWLLDAIAGGMDFSWTRPRGGRLSSSDLKLWLQELALEALAKALDDAEADIRKLASQQAAS
jgi:hypothetical protein